MKLEIKWGCTFRPGGPLSEESYAGNVGLSSFFSFFLSVCVCVRNTLTAVP